MKIKYLDLYDEFTHHQILLLQIEEVDQHKFKKRKFPVGFKIVIDMTESKVRASSGMNFIPEISDMSIAGRSYKMESSGTLNAFSLLLNSVEDIRQLPSEVNVNNIRETWNTFSQSSILNDLENNNVFIEDGNYKKVLYETGYGLKTLVIVDSKLTSVFSRGTQHTSVIADYNWLPVNELDPSSFKEFLAINELPNFYKQILTT